MSGILIVDQIQNSSNTLLINSGALAANTVGTTQLGSITNINSGFGNAMTLQANGTTAITVDTNQRTIVAGATNGGSYDSTSSGIYFQKQTSSAEVNVPFIRSEGDSTTTHLALGPSSTSGQLRFYQNGSQRWYINGSGNLTAYGSGLGITFNNASALTNSTLNDYETGTFTPAFQYGTWTYVAQTGNYTKVGNIVTVSIRITWSNNNQTSSPVGVNLPFVTGGVSTSRYCGSLGYLSGITYTSGNVPEVTVNGAGLTNVYFYSATPSGSTPVAINNNYLLTNGELQVQLTYQAAF